MGLPDAGDPASLSCGLYISGRRRELGGYDLQAGVAAILCRAICKAFWSGRGLAHPVIHERLVDAELVGQLRSYNIPTGIWHRYDRMTGLPDGILPAGEALTSYNPMYGQGISLSAAQALALRHALAQRSREGPGLKGLARVYFTGCAEINAQGWSVMETRDLAFSSTQGPRPDDFEERWRISRAIRRLTEVDPDVHRLSMRVLHLLEPASALQDPKIVQRALALADDA